MVEHAVLNAAIGCKPKPREAGRQAPMLVMQETSKV